MLDLQDINFTIDRAEILSGISASFMPGEMSVVIGPNGSGKSTLLKIASGEMAPAAGKVFYGDTQITKANGYEAATYRGVLTQHSELNFPLSVWEVIMMGRYPHFKNKPTAHDHEVVKAVMTQFHLHPFRERSYLTLSGGERQRVHFARVLAQLWHKNSEGFRYLLLDEPVSFLDLNYQHGFLKTAKEISRSGDVVMAVLHDINLAALYADKIFVLKEGRLIASGTPAEIITPDLIYDLYQLRCQVQVTEDGFPYILVMGN